MELFISSSDFWEKNIFEVSEYKKMYFNSPGYYATMLNFLQALIVKIFLLVQIEFETEMRGYQRNIN